MGARIHLLLTTPPADARTVPPEQALYSMGVGTIDAATQHRHPDVVQPPTRIVTVAPADAVDWRDVGFGAGGALGAVLVAAVAVSLSMRTRRGIIDPSNRLGNGWIRA